MPSERLQLGPYVLDTNLEALLRGGQHLAVGRRAVALLRLPVGRAGEVVPKDELMEQGWAGLAVEESNLAVQIASLRRLFAAQGVGEGWIETLPRRGYRFTGPVAPVEQAPAAPPPPPASPAVLHAGRPALAVLPFRTPLPDPVPQYLADGLAEELVSSLAGLADITVISFGTSSRLRGAEADLPQLRRDMGVRYVSSGSIRGSGDRARVLVELADAETSTVLTSRTYNTDRLAHFDTLDRMVSQIVQAIAPQVRNEELRRIRLKRPENLAAYDLVLRAREQIYQLDRASFDQSERLLTDAIAMDPDYAAAYALLAEFHSLRYGQGWSADPAQDAAAIARAAREAIDRDPRDARALAFLAHNKAFVQRDHEAALPLFERALDVAPNDAGAWMWSSVTFAYLGDGTEAVRRAELALGLSPRDWFGFQFHTALCLAHYTASRFDDAVRCGLAAIAENPRYFSALRYAIAAMAASGAMAQAGSLARDMLALDPAFRVSAAVAGQPYRDPARRERYGEHLRSAGLPA